MRLGIDLGGTKIEIIALADDGTEVLRRRVATPRGSYHGIVEAIVRFVRDTEAELAGMGGSDTEKVLFGQPGGYQTELSKNTVGQTCRKCGQTILKEAHLGGSVYVCPGCQRLSK